MSKKPLGATVTRVGNREQIVLAGKMTEGTERALEAMLESVGLECSVDFDAVTQINSCGVAEWIAFFREFQAKRSVVFERCPQIIVDLLGMAPAFRGGAVVKSVWIPFECETCRISAKALYEVNPSSAPDLNRLQARCKKCSEPMAMTCDPDSYLAFAGGD